MRHRRSLNLLVLVVLLLALLVVGACPAFAAGAPLPTPDTGTWVTNGTVNSSAIGQSGTNQVLFIGGSFSYVGPSTGCGVALDPSTGTVSAAFPSVNGTVLTAVADGSGGYYIGGSFSRVGTQTRNDIAHILSDGSVDPSFDPNVNNTVAALAVSGSTVYAGGRFTTANGGAATRNYLAAFDAATGAVASWKPDPNNFVNTLLVSGSTIYAGGSFTSVNTTTTPVPRNCLAAFDTTTGSATSWDPSANAQVYSLALSGSIIYAGGGFTSVNTTTTPMTRNYLAAFDTLTGTATTWDPNAGNPVISLAVSGSTVYAGGSFTTVNGGTPRNRLAAFDVTTGVATSWDPNANAQVQTVAVSGSTVYAGGTFTTVNGSTTRNRLAALDVATGMASSWNPSAGGIVGTLAVSGSTVYAGGGFSSVGGVTRSNLAAIQLTTGMATSWDPSTNGTVNAVVLSGTTVYAGGTFTSVNTATTPVTRNNLAAFNAGTGAAASFDPSPDNTVYALLVSGSTVYAGGSFTWVNTTSTMAECPYLAAFTTTGAATAWAPWPNGSVRALALSSDSRLYAGGIFTSVGSVPRNNLAAFDTMTGKTTSWDPNASGIVNTLLVSGSTVYAGGAFATVNQNVTRRSLAAFDATTGAATSWDPSAIGTVNTLLVAGSTVYAGGSFTSVNTSTTSATRNRLAAFDATTGTATSWDPNFGGGSVLTLNAWVGAGAFSGSLYAGGSFSTVAGVSRSDLASFTLDATPPSGSVTIGDASAFSRARSVTLHLSAADAHGPVLMQVRNAGDSWPLVWSSLSDIPWTLPSPDGDKRIEARFMDAAGNISTYSATVTLDTTPPSGWIWVANGAAVVNSTATTVETWASDLNGPVQMRLSNGGSPWTDWAPVIDDALQPWTLPSDDGTKVVGVQHKDAAGNIALCSQSVILDTAPPLGSLSIDSGATYTVSTSATLSLAATDAVGTTQVRLRNADDSTWGDWQKLDADDPTNVTADTGWTLPAGDGAKTVQAQFKDVGGNVSAVAGASVVVDTTKPVTTDNADGLPHRSFTLELTPTDATSGVVLTEYRIDGHAWREGSTVSLRLAVHRKPASLARGAHTIQYRSTDAAGNVESIKSCAVKLR
jgi:hypothetical protein